VQPYSFKPQKLLREFDTLIYKKVLQSLPWTSSLWTSWRKSCTLCFYYRNGFHSIRSL